MPEIKPFNGWRYDGRRAGNTAKLVAPPYDIISPAQQEKLYRDNPYNAIRLELAKDMPGDSASSNKYSRAADTLSSWKSKGILVRESKPALYVYEQVYKEGAKTQVRLGFMAAMKADESAVKKHEDTLAGPKEDRLKLLGATRTNLSPIWGLFEDPVGTVHAALKKSLKQKPVSDVLLDGVRHRLFVETRPEVIQAVTRAMKPKPMFIADGHHRFETASRFSREDGKPGSQYVLTYFSDVRHNPFKIYPTHRLLNVDASKKSFAVLEPLGKLEKVTSLSVLLKRLEKNRTQMGKAPYDVGLYSKKEGFKILVIDPKVSKPLAKGPVERLDVAMLHRAIVGPVYGITAIEKSPSIDFTRDAQEAVDKVSAGQWNLALFLRPTSLDEMILASKKGLKMPQKSTYFYPKLLTGLVFRGLDG